LAPKQFPIMKKSIFIFCLVAIGMMACQSEETNNTTANGIATSSSEVEVENSPIGASDHDVFPKPKSGAKASPQKARIEQVLATNYWVNTAYFHKKEKGSNRQNQGNWYQFNPDGSFVFGHMSNELTKGTWSFAYAGDVGQVAIKAENQKYSGLWNIKLVSTEDLMIWVGTEVYKTNGVQQRFENLMFIPKNRKELGLKE